MRSTCIFILLAVAVIRVHSQTGTCGGDCVGSDTCSIEAQDFSCRCSYFHCRTIPQGQCGGGCVNNAQCAQWANGDKSCVCGPLFECVSEKELEKPGYMTYAKFLGAAKKEALRKKVLQLTNDEQ